MRASLGSVAIELMVFVSNVQALTLVRVHLWTPLRKAITDFVGFLEFKLEDRSV